MKGKYLVFLTIAVVVLLTISAQRAGSQKGKHH
jgi:hypothetical protein